MNLICEPYFTERYTKIQAPRQEVIFKKNSSVNSSEHKKTRESARFSEADGNDFASKNKIKKDAVNNKKQKLPEEIQNVNAEYTVEEPAKKKKKKKSKNKKGLTVTGK